MLNSMAKSGDPAYPNLNWDQWSFWYAKVTGLAQPTPESHCQLRSRATSPGNCFTSHRWLRTSLRQWLWAFEKIHGCQAPLNACS